MRAFIAAFVLSACLTLPPAADALAGNWLGAGPALDAAQAMPIIPIKNDKQQQEKNKACGPGKVFVKNEGCVKREKAEKAKAKEKEEKAKKQTPAPKPDAGGQTFWVCESNVKGPDGNVIKNRRSRIRATAEADARAIYEAGLAGIQAAGPTTCKQSDAV